MLEQIVASLNLIVLQTQNNLHYLKYVIGIPWAVFLFSKINPNVLYLGIFPRKIYGLPGIVFAPLLHANFNHIFFNSIPLVVLSNFILINGPVYFLFVTAFITFFSGFLIWCFGKSGIHIGASALITGYWSFLVSGIFQEGNNPTAIILGLISAYYFAGIFFGIFPAKKGVSWEGHLFGFIAGLCLSFSSASLMRFL